MVNRQKSFRLLTVYNVRVFFAVNKTGSVGIEIHFAAPTNAAYQLLAYGVYPKAAVIEFNGNCTVVDNV